MIQVEIAMHSSRVLPEGKFIFDSKCWDELLNQADAIGGEEQEEGGGEGGDEVYDDADEEEGEGVEAGNQAFNAEDIAALDNAGIAADNVLSEGTFPAAAVDAAVATASNAAAVDADVASPVHPGVAAASATTSQQQQQQLATRAPTMMQAEDVDEEDEDDEGGGQSANPRAADVVTGAIQQQQQQQPRIPPAVMQTILSQREASKHILGYLKDFDAVVIGIRAFNVRTDLVSQLPALFAFVEAGGNVIEQYNRPGNDLKTEKLAPYSLKLSGDRVTDENATMTFLATNHPALNTPNKITRADFDGWVQERGVYFPNQWDEHFVPILACSDAGEAPKSGALLVAQYGKGYFVYTGLVFFRELPAGVPGAYRLFANLISLGK